VARLTLTFEPGAALELVRLARRYDVYLVSVATWLMSPLPAWIPLEEVKQAAETLELPE
jgi:hypothetical protein